MSDPTTPSAVPVPPTPGGTVERGPAGDELVVDRVGRVVGVRHEHLVQPAAEARRVRVVMMVVVVVVVVVVRVVVAEDGRPRRGHRAASSALPAAGFSAARCAPSA